MIILDTQLLKIMVADEEVLGTLTFQEIFLISLRIFLEKVLEVAVGAQEDRITEVLILDTI